MSAEQIARGLTEAQREALLLWDGGPDHRLAAMMHGLGGEGIRPLIARGLATEHQNAPNRRPSALTPLGLQVRAILQGDKQ